MLIVSNMCPSLIGLVSLIGSISVVEAFTPLVQQSPAAHGVLPLPSPNNPLHQRASILRSSNDGRNSLHLSSSTTTTDADTPGAATAVNNEPPILGGVQQFDSWFQSKSVGGKSQPELRHATFQSNTLRGLQYDGSKDRCIVEVPEKVVLRTEYNRNTKDGSVDENWDARLAVMLVKECLKGEGSDIFGYVAFVFALVFSAWLIVFSVVGGYMSCLCMYTYTVGIAKKAFSHIIPIYLLSYLFFCDYHNMFHIS